MGIVALYTLEKKRQVCAEYCQGASPHLPSAAEKENAITGVAHEQPELVHETSLCADIHVSSNDYRHIITHTMIKI